MTKRRGEGVDTYGARVNTGKAVHWFTEGSNIPWCTAGTARARDNWGRPRTVRPTTDMVDCKRCLSMAFKG